MPEFWAAAPVSAPVIARESRRSTLRLDPIAGLAYACGMAETGSLQRWATAVPLIPPMPASPTVQPDKAMPARMKHFVRLAITTLSAFALTVQPAAAQSILRDAETEALFHDMSAPLIKAAGLDPKNVDIVLIGDPEINAFVAGGQVVYVHSGLIQAADNANEVQGVIAHELGHIASGDVIRGSEGAKAATGITILSLILGAAAIAAGAGEAGAGIFAAGQQAALGKYLAFSRVQESGADQSGRRYLDTAGISGKGMVSFFQKLRGQEFRLAIAQDNAYDRTHPLTGERIQVLRDSMSASPGWAKPTDPALEARFQRVKAKLFGFINDPKDTLARYPVTNNTVPARYARAYAWHKSAYPEKAVAEADALLAAAPNDPYLQELKGQILLESGKPNDALPVLRQAVQGTHYNPLIAALFGHALIATENPANFAEAKTVLRTAIQRDNQNPFAWYQLGTIYAQEGDQARASLATAERFNLEGAPLPAFSNARMAMHGLTKGSNDWIRAQDIAMVSRAAINDDPRLRKQAKRLPPTDQ
jgi:predicted Zn-dependent protease